MPTQNNNLRTTELQMVKNDAIFYYDLVKCVLPSRKSSILMLGLFPYLSFFVVETYGYLRKAQPDLARNIRLQYEESIRNARNRIKLVEIHDLTAILDWVTRNQKSKFIDKHTGPLAEFKKLLQSDLGLYFYGKHLISTTHIVFSSTTKKDRHGNFDANVMGSNLTEVKSFAEEMGSYIASVYHAFVLQLGDRPENLCAYSISDSLVQNKAVKSDRYMISIFNGSSSAEINACLVLLMSFFNVVHYIVRNLTVDTPETFFKLKYVILYQVLVSLKKIQNKYYLQLADRSKHIVKDILDNKESRLILSGKEFRNILVHYTLDQFPENKINPNIQFFGIVEHFFNGLSMEDLNELLDRHMDKVSQDLENWLSSGQK